MLAVAIALLAIGLLCAAIERRRQHDYFVVFQWQPDDRHDSSYTISWRTVRAGRLTVAEVEAFRKLLVGSYGSNLVILNIVKLE